MTDHYHMTRALQYRDVMGDDLPDFGEYDSPTMAAAECSRATIARVAGLDAPEDAS